MSITKELLAEFEVQAPVTRKFLERLPEDKLTWKPHGKSMTAGQLALHIALVPGAVLRLVQCHQAEPPSFEFPQPASKAEILKAFDESVASVCGELPKFDDRTMNETWRMVAGDRELLALPRGRFVRNGMFSHLYQHRGQFSVYLRLLNIAVPSSWGPSADEMPAFMQPAEQAVA